MSEHAAVFRNLPTPVRRDPQMAKVASGMLSILVTFVAGSGTVEVADGYLHLVDDAGESSLTIDLLEAGLLLPTLIETVNATGIWSMVGSGVPSILAAALVDTDGRLPIGGPLTYVYLGYHTSPTWHLLQPVVLALAQARRMADVALNQLNLLLAGGSWADFWGRYTGTLRHASEADDPYTARQLYEVIRHRENNQALAALLEHDFGAHVTEVHDQRRDVFICSAVPMRGHPLAGTFWNADTINVILATFADQALLDAVLLNVAAGITAYVRGVIDFELGIGIDYTSAAFQWATPAAMQIGVGHIGTGKIGPP